MEGQGVETDEKSTDVTEAARSKLVCNQSIKSIYLANCAKHACK